MMRPLPFLLVSLFVPLLATLTLLGDNASARSLRADYSLSIRGFPVGKAEIRANISERRYSIAFSGGISGLAKLITDTRAKAEANGTLDDDRPRAETYSHVWLEDDDKETVSMHFSGRGVDAIAMEPPLKRPERYVPLTAKDKADALDLVSAFLWPTASGARPEACDRTLPLIDGQRRFDLDSAFDRMESFATRNGSRYYRAVVCSLSFRAIAGHRADNPTDGFLAEGRGMEVWLASAGGGLIAPVRVQIISKFGKVVMQATRFDVK